MGRQPTLSLASIGDQLALYSRPLHPTFLPYGALGLIHAARVSHATRQVAGSHKCRLGLWQSFLLNQILMFSGVVLSGMLLGIPSPLLGSWPFVVLYGGMHVLLDVTPGGKWLLNLQDQELVGMIMDLSFAMLDGILRSEGIIDLGVEAVRKHPSPEVSTSLFAALLNAAIIGGGIPLFVDLLKLDSPTGDWAFQRPGWTKNPWKDTTDLFSSAFLGLVYIAMTSPAPARFPLIGGALHRLGLDGLGNRDARTFCALLLGAILTAQTAMRLAEQRKPVQIKSTSIEKTNGTPKSRKQAARKQQ